MVMGINYRKIPVSKMVDGNVMIGSDSLAIESVIRLLFNNQKVATLLGSPNDSKYLLLGHLISEGYLKYSQLIDFNFQSIDTKSSNDGIDVSVESELTLENEPKVSGITTTSCGACNSDGLNDLLKNLPIVSSKITFDDSILHLGMESMKSLQKGFAKTGGMHSASLMSTEGTIICFAEDIGRHNAVDKVIGKSLEYEGANRNILLLSGRCGWDIVAKASRANIPVIACIGASSSLAADCARSLGIKIFAFVKESSHTIIG